MVNVKLNVESKTPGAMESSRTVYRFPGRVFVLA